MLLVLYFPSKVRKATGINITFELLSSNNCIGCILMVTLISVGHVCSVLIGPPKLYQKREMTDTSVKSNSFTKNKINIYKASNVKELLLPYFLKLLSGCHYFNKLLLYDLFYHQGDNLN